MIWDVPDLQFMQDVLGHLIPLPLNKRPFLRGPVRTPSVSFGAPLNKSPQQ